MSYLLAADKQCSSLTPEVRIQKLAQTMPAAICADPAMIHAIQTLSGALPQKRSPKNMGLNPFIKYLLNIVDRLLADFHSWLPAHKWLTPQSHRNNQYPQYVGKPSLASRKSFCSKNLRLDRARSTCFYLYVGEKIWDVDLSLFCFAFRSVLFFFFLPLPLDLYQEWSFFTIPANTSISSFEEIFQVPFNLFHLAPVQMPFISWFIQNCLLGMGCNPSLQLAKKPQACRFLATSCPGKTWPPLCAHAWHAPCRAAWGLWVSVGSREQKGAQVPMVMDGSLKWTSAHHSQEVMCYVLGLERCPCSFLSSGLCL